MRLWPRKREDVRVIMLPEGYEPLSDLGKGVMECALDSYNWTRVPTEIRVEPLGDGYYAATIVGGRTSGKDSTQADKPA